MKVPVISGMVKFPHFHTFIPFRSTGEIYFRVSSTTPDNFPDNFQTIYRHILENTEGPVKPESPPLEKFAKNSEAKPSHFSAN